ncbi:hypothetical protein OOK39_44970 [Streptomyces sp. NBC_00264]|uniref:hypothetical protein n=1 Tax=unclassified Streptomyces TaxID=2593676 RepID=UPI002256772A|nr:MULTISPECIES: hypothetical protein [unclassified Streptomyces]MCX5166192.1 hypothetical protein [Streptomyces sp. NBC_00305]MCX5224709.1 hypothetical protein [Streptomyces sp. NBC_00264]WSG56670.1 hypothetical protein OHA38_44055 [Streptomyces sp. NBC_01732]
MAVSISAVVLLAIVVLVLIRSGSVRLLPALACTGFGFFLASTGAAPLITDAISAVTGWISSI